MSYPEETNTSKSSTTHTALLSWLQSKSFDPINLDEVDYVSNLTGLEGLAGWTPSNDASIVDILCVASALAELSSHSCESFKRKIGKSLLDENAIDSDKLAELCAATLISRFVLNLESIGEEGTRKTPDFKGSTASKSIEFEVTNSTEKVSQSERKQMCNKLQSKLRLLQPKLNLKIRFVDNLTDNDIDNICETVNSIKIGEAFQQENLWYVEAVHNQEQIEEPDWLVNPYAIPVSLSFSFIVSPGYSATISDHLDIQWVLSTHAYINSLSKKTDASQSSDTIPFVILCDVTSLPGAFKWYSSNIADYMKYWDEKISSVIIINRSLQDFGTLRISYMRFENPTCKHNLPADFDIPSSGHVDIALYKSS
jgi:hypothetical protein